ncbi:alpha/beta fold hydrolase [Mesorhizobium xinjiangense]|uniref:alpha/beta fold hydrolase n=1 Tax=Mesorhizobium xinjiangense TaxID=2678685 RepID=UPI0012EEC8D2|nr:alpha/beta hydrolase [Mesorhizobium xinjiangense]
MTTALHLPANDPSAAAELLLDMPGNPMPDNAAAGFTPGFDGKKLRYGLFGPTDHPLAGSVVVLPGRNENIEKYFETIRHLAGRGLGTAILDWRGQGGSERLIRDPARGYVESFSHYVADLDRFFHDIVLPDCRGPYYVLGHSMGALVALLAAPHLTNRVERMVLCAPLLQLARVALSRPALGRLSGLLFGLGLGTMYLGGGPPHKQQRPFSLNPLTSDPERFKRNSDIVAMRPSLALGGPTVAWLRAACIAIETVTDPRFMARLRIPTLCLAAGRDEIVSTGAIEDYASQLRYGSVLTIDGARHELLQEADLYREQCLAALDAFIPGSG